MRPEELYREILHKLKRLKRKEVFLLGAESTTFFLFIFTVGLYVILFLEAVFRFSAAGRITLIVVLSVLSILSLLILLIKPIKVLLGIDKSMSYENLAQRVGFSFREIKDNLLNAIQIYADKSKNREYYSEELIEGYFTRVSRELVNRNFNSVSVAAGLLRRLKMLGIALSAGIVLFTFFHNTFGDSLNRILHPGTEFPLYPDFTLSIEPGDIEVTRGEKAAVRIETKGSKPDAVNLYIREEGTRKFEKAALDPVNDNIFKYEINKVKKPFAYYAEGIDEVFLQKNRIYTTDIYNVSVMYPPMIQKLKVKLDFPSYSGLGSRYLDDNNGDISSLKGTKVYWELYLNKPVSMGNIDFQNNKDIPLKIRSRSASAAFTIEYDDIYSIILEDNNGITNTDPIKYIISTAADRYPYIEVIEPGRDIDLEEGMTVPLYFKIQDDFGFSRLRLGYRKKAADETDIEINADNNEEKTAGVHSFVNLNIFNAGQRSQSLSYEWNLKSTGMMPEDEMIYYIEVYDNDAVSGPKRSVSASYKIRFPSLAELYANVDDIEDEVMEDMEEIFERNEQLRKKIDEIALDMKKNYDMNWEKKRELKSIADEQGQLEKKIENTIKRLEELTDKIEKNELVSFETMQKYKELQQILDTIISPEFKKAIEEMQRSLQDAVRNPEMRSLVNKMSVSQKDLAKRIERTLNIMKHIQAEKKMDEAVKKAEEILKKQKKITESLENTDGLNQEKTEEMASDEGKLRESAEDLRTTMEETAELMAVDPLMPARKINASIDMFDSRDIPGAVEKMSAQIRKNDIVEAAHSGKKIEKDMSDLSNTLKSAVKEMRDSQKDAVKNALYKFAYDFLSLSKKEEEVFSGSSSLDKSSGRFTTLAEKQLEILSGLSRSGQQLMELSQKTFFVTPEMGQSVAQAALRMQNSIKQLEDRKSKNALSSQAAAMSALNVAVEQIRNSLGKLEKASSASGLEEYLKKLEEMAGRQGGINDRTSEFPLGFSLSMSQQAEMLRLAREQAALQKALEELMNEMGSEGQVLGNLEQIRKEMKEIVKSLGEKTVGERTLRMQERVLSRLLDAQRSLNKRDYSKKRKSETAKEYRAVSPEEIRLSENRDRLYEDLVRALNEGYNEDFIRLIKKYFHALSERSKNPNGN